MPSILAPVSFSSFFDSTTGAVVQADLSFYDGGTLDAMTVYQDSGLAQPWEQPIRTTGNGRVPPIYIGVLGDGTGTYRFRAYDLDDVLLEDEDQLSGALPLVGEGAPVDTDPSYLMQTGDIIATFSNNVGATPTRSGFVRCNGGSIGNAGSNATEMASLDAQALFLFLWGQDAANMLEVRTSGTPGTVVTKASVGTAANGWSTNHKISVPDLRGRTQVGLDNMGSNVGAAGRLTATYFGNTAISPGQVGGLESHTLTQAQLAQHAHNVGDGYGYWSNTIVRGDPPASPPGSASALGLTNVPAPGGMIGYAGQVVVTGVVAPQTTTATGSGTAHENVQPSIALLYYMRL